MPSNPEPVIPNFFLYGEPPRTVGERFLHVEALDDRSRPSNWNIRPHAHANLHHVFFISSGSGAMRTDEGLRPFEAPCLLIVPVSVVHGFAYQPGALGTVLTVSEPYLRDIIRREPSFDGLFKAIDCIRLSPASAKVIAQSLQRLARELAWTAPGHVAAVEAALILALVEALRFSHSVASQRQRQLGPQAELVARFRELIELNFRSAPRLPFFLDALCVSESRLRQACVKVAGRAPAQLVHDRAIIEAKRILLYSNMTIAEAGRYIGFEDPAYFSRFFSRHEKESPRAFRARHEESVIAA